MPKKQYCRDYLKSIDAYAQPILVTYKQQKQYPTTFGGVLTIGHGLLFFFFIAAITDIIMGQNFNISTYVQNNVNNASRPTYKISPREMMPAFSVYLGNYNYSVQENMEEVFTYFGAYYTQFIGLDNGDYEMINLNVTLCKNLHNMSEIHQLYGGHEGTLICPNITTEHRIKLGGYQLTPDEFRLTIGTCESLASITGNQNCTSRQDSLDQMPMTKVNYILATQLPNGYTYLDSNVNQSYRFTIFDTFLSNTSTYGYNIFIDPILANFQYNWFYSPFTQSTKNFTQISLIPPASIGQFDPAKIQEYSYKLTDVLINEQWQRSSFMNMVGDLGGISAIIVFFIGNLVQTYASFSIDNDMVSNIYSQHKAKEAPKQASTTSINDLSSEVLIDEEQTLRNYILSREKLKYNQCLAIKDYIKNNWCCCFCNKYCCRQSKQNKVFKKAQSRLYSETDLVKLIKLNRLSKFLSSSHMKPHHWTMIQNFDAYSIKQPQSDSEDESSSSNQEDIVNDLQKADPTLNQIDDHHLSWYFKAKNQKQIVSDAETDRLTLAEKRKLEDWLSQLKQMSILHLYKRNFTPHENGENSAQSTNLDLVALKLLVGESWKGNQTIQEVLHEINQQYEETEAKVVEFMESPEGKSVSSRIRDTT